jgi:hypothetical protein
VLGYGNGGGRNECERYGGENDNFFHTNKYTFFLRRCCIIFFFLFFSLGFSYAANPNVIWCFPEHSIALYKIEIERANCSLNFGIHYVAPSIHNETVGDSLFYCLHGGSCDNSAYLREHVKLDFFSTCCGQKRYPPSSIPSSIVYTIGGGMHYGVASYEIGFYDVTCGALLPEGADCVFDIEVVEHSSSSVADESSSSASDGGVSSSSDGGSSSSGGASSGSQGMSSGDGGVSSADGGGRSSADGGGGSSSAGCVWYYHCSLFSGNYGNSACLPTRPYPNNALSHPGYLYKQESDGNGWFFCHYTTLAQVYTDSDIALSMPPGVGRENYIKSNCAYLGLTNSFNNNDHPDNSLIFSVCASDVSFPSSSSASYSSNSSKDYWCDLHPDDDVCKIAGYDEYCDSPEHYDEAYCAWSRDCSRNPHMDGCVNPQPPGGSASSAESSSSSEAISSSSFSGYIGSSSSVSDSGVCLSHPLPSVPQNPLNACFVKNGRCYKCNPARGSECSNDWLWIYGFVPENVGWWYTEIACDGFSSSSSQETSGICKENKRGPDAVYTTNDCFSSGLDNMEPGKCYSLNPDRGTQYGWINNNAQDRWWWRETSCGEEYEDTMCKVQTLQKRANDWMYAGKEGYSYRKSRLKPFTFSGQIFDALGRMYNKAMGSKKYYSFSDTVSSAEDFETQFDVRSKTIQDSEGNYLQLFIKEDKKNGFRIDSVSYHDGRWLVFETNEATGEVKARMSSHKHSNEGKASRLNVLTKRVGGFCVERDSDKLDVDTRCARYPKSIVLQDMGARNAGFYPYTQLSINSYALRHGNTDAVANFTYECECIAPGRYQPFFTGETTNLRITIFESVWRYDSPTRDWYEYCWYDDDLQSTYMHEAWHINNARQMASSVLINFYTEDSHFGSKKGCEQNASLQIERLKSKWKAWYQLEQEHRIQDGYPRSPPASGGFRNEFQCN